MNTIKLNEYSSFANSNSSTSWSLSVIQSVSNQLWQDLASLTVISFHPVILLSGYWASAWTEWRRGWWWGRWRSWESCRRAPLTAWSWSTLWTTNKVLVLWVLSLSTSEFADIFQPLDLVSDTLNSLKERDGLRDTAVIVVGNKSDLERSREVSSRQGVDLAMEYQVKFTETSAGYLFSQLMEVLLR